MVHREGDGARVNVDEGGLACLNELMRAPAGMLLAVRGITRQVPPARRDRGSRGGLGCTRRWS